MGSKRAMLRNGLGHLIDEQLAQGIHTRFVDLFAGSAAVAWHVAQRHEIPVIATDLQLYTRELAQAVLGRTAKISADPIWRQWQTDAQPLVEEISAPVLAGKNKPEVFSARAWAEWFPEGSLIRAYGGHYYSPLQTAWIEALRATLPRHEPDRSVCLAALIIAASKAAASPGHTAQPFQPTKTANRFIEESWSKSLPVLVKSVLELVCAQHARSKGIAKQADANVFSRTLRRGDLAFVDPPYSGVHYSRFYHVLESIAQGSANDVSGVGRYPPPEQRPKSAYSAVTTSQTAVEGLLRNLASRQVDVIFTFPDHECSNGLSGADVEDIAAAHFSVETRSVHTSFSTLGGGRAGAGSRLARQKASELILVLRTKRPH